MSNKYIERLQTVEAEQYNPEPPAPPKEGETPLPLLAKPQKSVVIDNAAIHLEPGDWVITYATGRQEVLTDTEFKDEFAPVVESAPTE